MKEQQIIATIVVWKLQCSNLVTSENPTKIILYDLKEMSS